VGWDGMCGVLVFVGEVGAEWASPALPSAPRHHPNDGIGGRWCFSWSRRGLMLGVGRWGTAGAGAERVCFSCVCLRVGGLASPSPQPFPGHCHHR
jgi:hypothetical protein